jgi:hypothetical protein
MKCCAHLLLFALSLMAVMPEGLPTSPTPAVAQQVRRGVNRGPIVRARVARPGPRRPALRALSLIRR